MYQSCLAYGNTMYDRIDSYHHPLSKRISGWLLPLKLPVQILMVPYVQKLSGKVSSVEFTKDLAVTQGLLYAIGARIMSHYHA